MTHFTSHIELSKFNHHRLDPALPSEDWREQLSREYQHRLCEGEFVEKERQYIAARAAQVPRETSAFIEWFEALKDNGPGQNDPLFPWLATRASLSELKWFLAQEVGGEAGFDDLVALTQLKFDGGVKIELGRNYWDELGRGFESAMHGPMLTRISRALNLQSEAPVVPEASALGNLMLALASNRRYAYHAIGALGVIELTAPGRAAYVNQAMKRHGIAPKVRQYFALHATLDIKHSEDWNREVLAPIVTQLPEVASAIAEGALMRLEAGRRCFECYRRELGLNLNLHTCAKLNTAA